MFQKTTRILHVCSKFSKTTIASITQSPWIMGWKVAPGPLSQETWPVVINDFSCLRNTRLDGRILWCDNKGGREIQIYTEGTALSIAGDEFW